MDASPRGERVREITSARSARERRTEDLHTVSAQLSLTSAALARLLSVSGSQTNFILASADGATTVHARLAVSSVPEGRQLLGDGQLTLDWSRGVLQRGDRSVSLSRMELRMLAALMESGPRAVTREQLAQRLWQDCAERGGEREKALPVWIFQLRRRFAAIGIYDVIRTVRGVGYLLQL